MWRGGGGGAWRGVRAGADPGEVFGLAYAVVARWWQEVYGWEREKIWPRRLHLVAGGDAGVDLERWRVVGRDAVIFPEAVAVADALLDPVMAELAWADSGGERPRPHGADGVLCRRDERARSRVNCGPGSGLSVRAAVSPTAGPTRVPVPMRGRGGRW